MIDSMADAIAREERLRIHARELREQWEYDDAVLSLVEFLLDNTQAKDAQS